MNNSARRVIFLIIAVAVILPVIFNIHLGTTVTPETRQVFANIDSLPSGADRHGFIRFRSVFVCGGSTAG